MNGFTSVLAALALLQAEPGATPRASEAPAATAAPSPREAPEDASPAAPTPTPTPTATQGSPPSPGPGGEGGRRRPAPPPSSSPPPHAAPTGEPAPARARAEPPADRADAERAAREFLDALASSDAARLAAAAAERFSFDGDTVTGRDAIRGRWRALLAGRAGPAPRVGTVEVVSAADAVARLGKPPARIAPLARPGAWVALADVGERPVVLFVAREGGRMAVLGMHD